MMQRSPLRTGSTLLGACVLGLLATSCFFKLDDAKQRPEQVMLVPGGADWTYLDTGGFAPGWEEPGFDDSSWKSGPAELGYGPEETPVTRVNSGPDNQHFITTYFRHHFDVQDALGVSSLLLEVVRDDGIAVYVNGVEAYRDNLPTGPLSSTTPAVAVISGPDEAVWNSATIDPGLLSDGDNVIAAEVHQDDPTSSDIRFNLRLEENP